jgi:CheY-like chemotaxis protein
MAENAAQILVVDDSSFSRGMVVTALKELDFAESQIHQADSGASALDKIRSQRVDLFVLDIIMSEIDGVAVLKEVKNTQPEAKVIMCSGSNSDDLIKELVALGIDAFIVKPFRADDFKKAVARVLPGLRQSALNAGSLLVKCHTCDSAMIEVDLINTLSFYCPRGCMQIGPLVKALATQAEFDKDYERAKHKQ